MPTTGEREGPRGTARRVLDAVRVADRPPSITALSTALDLHANTVRAHLRDLEAEGLVERDHRGTGRRGRPRIVYRPTARGERSGQRNYELLATILLARMLRGGGNGVPEARAAGRSWGALLGGREPSGDGPGKASAAPLRDILAEGGFDPRPGTPGPIEEIRLHNCPFRELVDSHGQLVCALHAGFLEGLVQGDTPRRSSRTDVALVPFDTPTTCVVRLSRPR